MLVRSYILTYYKAVNNFRNEVDCVLILTKIFLEHTGASHNNFVNMYVLFGISINRKLYLIA